MSIPNNEVIQDEVLKNKLYYFRRMENFTQARDFMHEIGCYDGYADREILEAVIESYKKVRNGEALYEQDGVAYYKEHNNYQLLFSLYYTYSKSDSFNVLDYGGALGSTFYRYHKILPIETKWFIVEQKHYVEYGKKHITDINFYYDINECYKDNHINALIMSSVLQYLDNPKEFINQVCNLRIPFIIIDETPFVDDDKYSGTYIQHIPDIYYGSEKFYPVNIFFKKSILNEFFDNRYQKSFEWLYDGTGKGIPIFNGKGLTKMVNRGFILELMN